MADVWFVGQHTLLGPAGADTRHVFTAPLSLLVAELGVGPKHFVGDPDSPPKPNEGSDFGRKQKVVVQVDDKEASAEGDGWEAGFYEPKVSPSDASAKLRGKATHHDLGEVFKS